MRAKRDPLREDHRLWLFGFLSGLPRTEQEVRNRLSTRGVEGEEREALIHEFRELNLLDDAAYARLFAEGHENWGCDRVAYELSRRGVSREHIASALEGRDEEPQARTLAEGWTAEGFESRQVAARLRRRGFSAKTIGSVLRVRGEIPW